jgi:hypothetical protein
VARQERYLQRAEYGEWALFPMINCEEGLTDSPGSKSGLSGLAVGGCAVTSSLASAWQQALFDGKLMGGLVMYVTNKAAVRMSCMLH